MAERPLYTLYKNLKAQNYDVPDDYNKFESALTRDGKGGADNRHAIYENLKSQNFDVPNTYERFYSALFEPRSKTSSRAKGGSVPMSAADRARFSAVAAAISASAQHTMNNAGRYNRLKQRKQKQQKDFGRVNLGTHQTPYGGDANNVVKDDFAYNPETGKAGAYVSSDNKNVYSQPEAEQEQAVLDQQNNAYQNAVDTGEIPSVFDVRDKNGNYDLQENINKNGTYLTEEGARNQFDKKLADAYARKKEIEALIAEDHRQHGNPLLSYGASIGASNGRTAEQSDYSNKLATSLALVKQQIGALEAVKQYPTSSWGEDALKALDNTAFTAKTWDFGLTDFATMGQMERIKTKMDNNLPLSGSDKMLLKSKLGADAAAALEDEKMGNIYRWTKIAGQSLPFMADFFLTGGYGGITKAISRGALKFAAKRGMGKVSAAILKNTGIVAGDVIGSYAMAGSEQAMKTGADIMQRHLGSLYQDEKGDYKFGTFDENGNLLHEGGESMGTALYKGLTSAMVENYTEKLFGHSYGIKKGSINFMEKHGMNASAEFFKNIGKSGWYTNSKKWMEKFGINGFGEEVMEEEIGIPLHALLDGDNKFSDLLDTKQQLDIIGGMALSVGSMYAMSAGSRPVKGVYNRAQYYRFRNKVNVADSDAQHLMGDKWADIKNKIDNSTNEQMGGVLADILRQRDTMSKDQINAAINYGINLMKMRGYNVAKTAEMNAREITNEPTTPEEQHQEDIDNAYSEGHDADDADKHDIQLEHEDQMKTLAAALNISEQQLSAMNDDELQSLTGQNDKLDQAIYDYQLSSARYQGVTDDAQDKIDMAANQAAQRVDMYTDKSRGSVRNATVKASGGAEDYGVYIISGNIATNEDGSINVADSDDMILFYDPTTNSVEHADALRFAELGDEVPADDVKAQAVADAKEKAIKEVAGIVDGTIDVGSQFKVTGADGLEHTYEILADYGDGTAAISIDGNVVENPYSLADLQQLKDLEDQKRLEAAKAEREQMEKERAEQTQETELPEETQPSFDFNQILNDNGNVVLVDVLDKDGNTKYPDSKLFLIRDTGAKAKVVEMKSDGTFVPHAVSKKNVATISSMSLDEYKQAMAETSMIEENSGAIEGDRGGIEVNDELPPVPDNVTINGDGTYSVDGAVQGGENTTAPAEQTEQTPAMTLEDGTIVPMLEDGNPDFSKLTADQTAELYDSQFGDDAESVISGWVSDAKKALDKANNMTVKGKNFVEQKAAKEAKEKAIADAQAAYDSAVAIRDAYNSRQLAKVEDTAEGRKELIEKARRKFSRLKSAVKDDAEAVSQLYKDIVGSLLHRLYDGTGIDVTDTIPLTAEEYVASNLGAHSLNYEGTETSKGVKQETGLSREDFAKTQLLAADGKGTTIDDLVHSLWENRPSNLESLDTQDIRNALIGVLTSGFKASEARNYIENLRIAQAENILEEQKKAADNAAFAEEQKAKQEEEEKKAEENAEEKAEEKTHSEAFNKIVDLAKNLEEILDNPDNVKEIDKITHEIDELLETLSDEEFKEVSDVLLNIDEDLEYLTADEYERREGVEESKKTKAYNESLQQAIKRIAPYADALKAAVKSGDKKAIAKAQKELTDALLASNLGHGYLSGQLEYAKSAKKKDESYSERRALVKPLTDAINAIESALDSALAEAGLEGVHVDFTEGGHGWIYADKGSAWSSRLKPLDNDYRNIEQYDGINYVSSIPQITLDNVAKVAGIIKSQIEEGERYNSDDYNDEDEQTNENINAPEQNKFPDKLKEGSKTIEVPEDATEENPLGAQRDQTDLPFSAKENGKQQTTAERAADVEKNKVDDMKVVDNIVGEKTRKAFERLAKMMGADIQWQYSDKLGNGWIQETKDADGNVHRTIFITLDSSVTEGAQFIFGHEMTHQIKSLNPAAYNELTQLVIDTYGSDAFDKAIDETMKRYSDAGFSGRARDYYAEEVVADAVGEMIRDLNLAHTLAMKMSHPLLAAIHEILQKIKLAFFGTEYSDVTKNIIRSIEQAYVKTANGEVTNSETGEDVSFSLRQKPEPKKKGIGYKVFVLKDGKLYPPMVANPDGAATPVGVWLDADAAPIAGESKTGRPQVKQGGKGTQGGSGKLAYRPGWHLGVVPYAIQFNRKDAEGNKTLFPKNFVFAEVEYAADVDYQEEARQEGINPSGKYQHSLAGLKHLPTDGYYMYRTNPNPETDPWVITGAMKVNRILTRAEQAELVKKAGREPQQIQEGDIVTDDVVNSINQEIADAPKFSLKVYHGSGADFTEFDFDHMGEGAGSQVFGWGGYVTSSKKIGKSYANLVDANAPHQDVEYVGNNAHEYTDVVAGLFNGGQRDYDDVKEFLQNGYNSDKDNARKKQMLEWFESTKPSDWKSVNDGKRNLYEVDIPEDNGSNYLEWEKKPSDEVATKIIEGLYGLDAKTLDDMASKDIVFRTLLYDYIKNADKEQMIPLLVKTHALTRETTYDNGNVEDDIRFVYNRLSRWMGSPKAASQFLSSLGFTGIKYPAGTIMGGAEENDTNYVIFKPEDMKITEHTKFSLKSKPVRFEAGKKLSDEEKKEVLSTLKDAYKVNGVPYHIEETAGGKEKRVYEPTADSYVVSDITNRPLRYYITLPDGRVAHPTEVYPNISDNEVKSSATKQGLLDDEADQIVSAAIGNMKNIADNAKAVEVLTELQNLPHETHDVGYGLNNAQSYNYKTGIFTSGAAQAIDYVVRRMRRKEDVPAEFPAALKKAVADSYGMVDNLIDGMSSTKFSLKKDGMRSLLDVDGKPVVVREENGNVDLNYRTWQDEKELVRDALVTDAGLEEDEADAMIAQADVVADAMKSYMNKYPRFRDYQYAPAGNREIIRDNGDYLSWDYSFNCIKKDAMNAVMDKLVSLGKSSHLGVTQVEAIKKILQKHKFLTPCVMCYVEGKRKVLKQSKADAQKWNSVREYAGLENKEMGEPTELTDEQQTALKNLSNGKAHIEGIDDYSVQKIANLMLDNDILRGNLNYEWMMSPSSFTQMYNKFGNTDLMKYMTLGQYRGKQLLEATPFSINNIPRELYLKMYSALELKERGGLRQFSYEDARAMMFFDYYTQFLLMQGARSPEHLYTKRPFMPEMFGKTGAMINQSLIVDVWGGDKWHQDALGLSDSEYDSWLRENAGFIPRGALPADNADYKEGSTELVPAWSVESFPLDKAMENIHNRDFKGNVGNTIVAPSHKFIQWALDNPDIHMILAYHAAGGSPIMKSLSGYDKATAMDDGYHTLGTDGKAIKTIDDKLTGVEISGGALQWNRLLRKNGYDAKKAAQTYLDFCKENGFTPMFNYEGVVDHPNYYKMLTDFRVYDEDGKSIKQKGVKAILPDNWQEILNKYLEQEQTSSEQVSKVTLDENIMKEIDAATKFTSIELEERDSIMSLLQKIYGKGNVEVLGQNEFDVSLDGATSDGRAQMLRDMGGMVYGYAAGNRIVLNEYVFNANTPLHEHAHLYMKVLSAFNPRLYQRGMELWRDTPQWNDAKSDIERLGEEPTDDRVFSECMAQFTGTANEDIISKVTGVTDKNWIQKALEWMKEMWDGVKSAFKRWTKGDLDALTADDFAHLPLRAFYDTEERNAYIKNVKALNDAGGFDGSIRFSLKEEKEKILADAKANGTYMTAPNGEKTKLDAEQWATVRTTNFKNWFGDWENDPENASKVVDENGEPMVMYHYTDENFTIFGKDKEVGKNTFGNATNASYAATTTIGHWFTSNKNQPEYMGKPMECFLNIVEPFDGYTLEGLADYLNNYISDEDFNSYEEDYENVAPIIEAGNNFREEKIKDGYDGVVIDDEEFGGTSYVAFNANQIKSAENNNGDFSADNNDIRFSLKAMMEKPEGWKQANKKAIHIAEAIERDPKFSLKNLDGTLIKAGTYFSGGGLVEEGLKGIIDPVVAVEYDEKISGVYRNNFGQHIVTADVRDVDPKELVKQIDGEVEYFHASPVCKNYSQAKSNHAEVELDKETAASTAEFINAIKPKVVTIENVKGYKDSEAMKIITDALDANGYTWDADVYNAADYGGYTNRERLIVRAVRDGKLPEKPKKMAHKSGWYEAVADIIPTLTEKKNGVAPWMDIRLKADGIDWRNIDKPLYVMGSAYADGKIPHAFADELLPTLRTKSGDVIVMPDGKVYRAMGRVLARVSGVSDDYKMPFSENLSHTIIGNGIPTQLTEHVIAPLLQNTLRPTTPDDGSTKFSLRYDKFEHDLNQWKKDNNLPKDAQRPTIPQRNAGESAVDFLRRVDEYRKQMSLWKTAPTYEQHLLSDDTALGEFNRELQRGSVLKRIAFQDSMLAIRKAQEAIMKEVGVDRLNMAEDAYTAENRSHGKGKNEFEEYNNEFLQPLRKAYHQMKKVLGDSYDNVRVYMMAKHGLERDAQMAFKKSLEADYEDVNQRSAAYKAYKNDLDRVSNDADLEFGRVDFTTWRQKDNALRGKYSPSYMDYRYDDTGIAYDYSGLSSLFDGSDFEEAAHRLVRDVETKHLAEVQALWNATNAATKKILRDGFKAGMMSKDAYEYVKGMYSHYIPLRGWDGTTADQVWDYIGGGKGAFNQTLKTAHGRTSIADDPIAYIENMAESGILLNNKNWVKQHLMLLAQNHPTSLLTLSKAWYVKSTDANGNEEWIPATPQITSQMNSNQVKAAIDAFEQKMEQLAQTGDATQQRDGLNIAYPQTHSEEREHEVRVMKDGEEYVIYVNGDPQLAQAMNNTRAHRVREIQSGKLDRAAAWLGRKMAAAYTSLSPLFIPSNYFRDLTMTLASTAIREDGRYNYLLIKNLATSWNLGFMLRDYQNGKLREKVSNGNATAKEQMFYDFMMNGGETGFVSSLDVEDLKKKFKNDLKDLDRWKANPVKVGHTIMDGIEFLNRAIEDSNRFAVYMTSIQYGRSIDEAVNDAKDVTLNFNRKGTGEYGWQMIRNLYLFINPAVQSLQTLGALTKHHPFKFTAVTAAWLASGVLVPIVNAALMSLFGGDDDKDKYWQFSKWDRRNNAIMWIPFTNEYVKIPLAQEFRAFYGIGDMIASKMMGGELAEETWSQYAEDLLGQVVDMLPLDPTGYDGNIAVSLMPNPIRPVFELAFNVDFTGKPLFKDTEYNKYDPNFTKAYVGTPDWLVRVSKMVNSIGNDYPDVQQNAIDAFGDPRYNLNNPAVVDHVLSSYLGGAYTMGSQVLGVLTKSLNDPKEIKMADIPLVSKFVSNPDDRPVTKKQGDEFWNMKENHDRAANTLSKLKKQAKVDGDYSMLERFYGSEEYKQYKQEDVKVKKYEEDKKKERAEESGEEYRPHKLNAEDIYKAHATPKDDFEDLKLKQLFTKLNGFKTSYDLLVDTAPSQSDGYYNTNKAAIDAIDEISLDKQEISELKKGFLEDGKDAYNAEDMKRIRELRKRILSVLEPANKVVVANQKAKAEKK